MNPISPKDNSRRGTSLIDFVISMAIVGLLFGGFYLVYFSILTALSNITVRAAASTALGQEIETIRNLPYDSVGTVGGIPSGVIPQIQSITVGKYTFNLQTVVRNIDDPFDGTLGGTPNDTAPADYKLVSVTASCTLCQNFVPITITTTVSPKNLESATQNGSLFIYALDANGQGLADATIQVTNASVTPTINLIDTTNASGVLQLVGVPTSTQGYNIVVTKSGYSTDQTLPSSVSNPNPVKPKATVAAQTVTGVTFSIDALSSVRVLSSNSRCGGIANEPFTVSGSKLIGTSPDVLKFSTSSNTGATASTTLPNIEWDTYTFGLTDAAYDVLGTIPVNPLVVDPSSTPTFRFVLQAADDPALLVTLVDAATGASIPGASINISKSGYSKTLVTNRTTVTDTDWSSGNYFAQSGGIDIDSMPGKIMLLANASGTYATGTTQWLISNTIDLGGSSTTLYTFSFAGTGNPLFQLAANNDNATWNFVGPDGTNGSYFTATSSVPGALWGNRYVRYTAYLETDDPNTSPTVSDVSLEFNGDCVPSTQSLFTNLPTGSYTIDATASGYAEGTTTASVSSGFQSATLELTHL